MKDFVMSLLNNKLPPSYHYHNAHHTLYVLDKAIEIAQHENCSEEEIRLLSTAALWHDVGFINIYDGHEKEGCKLVKEYLPGYGYSAADIDIICGMIMATKLPQSPHTKLESILADADLEYLGTETPDTDAENLFRERQTLDPSLTKEVWDLQQIAFLRKHHYFTDYCKVNRAPVKEAYLNKLLNKT